MDVTGGVILELVLAAVVGAEFWKLLTWYFGIPSSSSHALIGGLIGAALMGGVLAMIQWDDFLMKVIVPMVISPVGGFIVAFALMTGLLWLVRHWSPAPVNRWFCRLQVGSAAFMAVSHGRNDTQNAMGVITLALLAAGQIETFTVPL